MSSEDSLFTPKITHNHDDNEAYSFVQLIEPLTAQIAQFDQEKPFIQEFKTSRCQ